MELTPAEERLIKALREIDAENPLGIDAYTEDAYIEMCLRAIGGAAAAAGRRYRLFLEESKGKPSIDITEAQRHKAKYEDTRAEEKYKAEYEKMHRQWPGKYPAPKWLTKGEQRENSLCYGRYLSGFHGYCGNIACL